MSGGDIEWGKCEICGKEGPLERTYFYYPVHCECCGSKDKDGQKQHFVLVRHCDKCPAPVPPVIHPICKDATGKNHEAYIVNMMPSRISGQFIIDEPIIKEE